MMIIGCDYHPGFQQIAFVDTETGELQERRLGLRISCWETWKPQVDGRSMRPPP